MDTAITRPLRILSLGISLQAFLIKTLILTRWWRGVSALLILESIERIRDDEGLAHTPLPYEYFDMIGGTSTGGIIAIMLGRLQMSVDECIRAFKKVAEDAFKPKAAWQLPAKPTGAFSARAFEEAIKQAIVDQCKEEACRDRPCQHADKLFRDGACCNTVVLAITKDNVDAPPTLFKTYDRSEGFKDCTIWQVARATSAATTFFKYIKFGRDDIEFVDAGFGYNNPCDVLLEEAKEIFPSGELACVLSIGTGLGAVAIQDSRRSILRALREMATSSKRVEDRLDNRFGDGSIYYRFNVQRGLEDISLSDWRQTSTISAHTRNYLQDARRRIDLCSKTLIVATRVASGGAAATPRVRRSGSTSLMVIGGGEESRSADAGAERTELLEEEHRAIDKLRKSIAMSAYHDSNERSASSGCLEGTRHEQIKTIMEWVESEDEKEPVFLVLGPAGSGKTSLVNTIAENCKGKGNYAAGYFFSATDSARNMAGRFLNTIVYQVSVAIPQLQPYIARIIAADSTILSRSLGSQTTALLVEPFRQLRLDFPGLFSGSRSFVIVVDALDECGSLAEQRRVIAALAQVLSDGSFPLVCLLTSRFHPHIEHEIATTLTVRRVDLGEDSYAEKADIRAYLDARLNHIRNKHAFGKRIPKGWPSESDLQNIVKKSGGQFIYASTVIGYIESPEHNPHERLRYILGVSALKLGEDPFAELDALYLALMSSVKNRAATIEILGIELVRSNSQFWMPKSMESFDFEGHFRLLDGDVVLAPLASVLKCQDGRITFYHLSFAEFLLASTRSQGYFVQPMIWQKWIVSQLVPHFYQSSMIDDSDTVYLIQEAKRSTDLHQAINDGIALVTNHPKCLPFGGDFNLWPFVTSFFFLQLGFYISIDNMADIFLQREENFLSLSVLIKLACATNHTNSLFLFELCRTLAELQKSGIIEPRPLSALPFLGCSSSRLALAMTYLNDYLDARCLEQGLLSPKDYISASLRCLWYLQSSTRDIRCSLMEQLRSLGPRIGTSRYGVTCFTVHGSTFDFPGTSDSGVTIHKGTFATIITPDHVNLDALHHLNISDYLSTSNSGVTYLGDSKTFIPNIFNAVFIILNPIIPVTSHVTIRGGTFIAIIDNLNSPSCPSNVTPMFPSASDVIIKGGNFFSYINPDDTFDYLNTPTFAIHGGTFAVIITPDYVDTSDYLGTSDYLKDPSTNLTHGALDALPVFLLHSTPYINLLRALKQPFDSEVLVRTPASSCDALFSIHDYLMRHDPEYQYSTQIDLAGEVGQDEPLPEFVEFLRRKTHESQKGQLKQ